MSLEAAAKELERLETQMQKRVSAVNAGGDDVKRGNWWEGTTDAQASHETNRTQDSGTKADEKEQARRGSGPVPDARRSGDAGKEGLVFELSLSSHSPADKHVDDVSAERQERRRRRDASPTRVHLTRTGSVEIERGGEYLPERTTSHPTTAASTQRNGSGAAATAAASRDAGHADIDNSKNYDSNSSNVRITRFDHSSGRDAASAGEGQHWSRDASWRVRGLDDADQERLAPSAWTSLPGELGYAPETRSGGGLTGWGTEADADLSDIKATMRRIDGASGSASGIAGAPYGFEVGAGARSSSARGAPGAVRSTARDSAVPIDYRDGIRDDLRASNPAIPGFRDGVRSSNPTLSGLGGGATSGLYSSIGGESARALGWGASSGSKAVLSALRALQDKIRKLESERDRAAVEAGTLRRQIMALQSESERTAQVNLAGEQEKMLASRLAYERLQADKNTADMRLRKADEQKRTLARETEAAKERSRNAEAARRVAEARVSTLEDRLLGLGRREEAEVSADVRSQEQVARRRQENDDHVEALKTRVARIEASISAEKSLRMEAQDGLAQALAAKEQTERYLQEVLQANQDLVLKATRGGAPASGSTAAGAKKKKIKRSSTCKPSGMARGRGKAIGVETRVSRPPPPRPPPPPPHGGFIDSGGFNVGTHTAKRAKNRARKSGSGKMSKRKSPPSVSATATAAPCVACEKDPRLKHGASDPRRKIPSTITTADAAAVAAALATGRISRPLQPSLGVTGSGMRKPNGGGGGGAVVAAAGGPGVPFVTPGTGPESYNVVSAVSKAVRTARRGRPRESLDTLYADVGAAVRDSASDVPFMFHRRHPSHESRQHPQASKQSRQTKKATVKLRSRKPELKSTRSGRTVLDVAIPDLDSLNLGSNFPVNRGDQQQYRRHASDTATTPRSDEPTNGNDGSRRVRATAEPELWNRRWDKAEGRDRRGRAGRGENGRVRNSPGIMMMAGVGNGKRPYLRDNDNEAEEDGDDDDRGGGVGGYGEDTRRRNGSGVSSRGRGNSSRTGSQNNLSEHRAEEEETEEEKRGRRGYDYGAEEEMGSAGDGDEERDRGEADEDGSEDNFEEENSRHGDEGMSPAGLPTTDDSLSSGDERAWQNYRAS